MNRFQAALNRVASPAISRSWKRVRDTWLRDPVEIEVLLNDEAQRPRVRVGRSKKFVELDRLRRWFRPWRPLSSVTVCVPIQQCLVRVIQLPKTALSRANEILQVDLERTTPFRDDVLTGWYRSPQEPVGDLVSLHHVILKQDLIVPVLDEIRSTRLPIKAVFPVDSDGSRLPVNLLPAAQRNSASAVVAVRMVLLGCTAALYAFTIFAFWLTISSLDAALVTTESAVRKATEQAREISTAVTKADTLAAQFAEPRLIKMGTPPVIAIWEEVTRLLPESTWLTTLRIEEDAVHIDGNSGNASELIALLAKSPLVREVTFASPVTRDQKRDIERFQIKMLVTKREGAKTDEAQLVSE